MTAAAATFPVAAEAPLATPLAAIPTVEVSRYLGSWYQVAWFPNRFQAQCASDTTARYRQRDDGRLDVLNRCRTHDGRFDEASGVARPVGTLSAGHLRPAQLEVSFLPAVLRWLGIGWGRYWVIQLADDYRYAVISEPSREYLWVLSRSPRLSGEDESLIRARLQQQGFDLRRLVRHEHAAP